MKASQIGVNLSEDGALEWLWQKDIEIGKSQHIKSDLWWFVPVILVICFAQAVGTRYRVMPFLSWVWFLLGLMLLVVLFAKVHTRRFSKVNGVACTIFSYARIMRRSVRQKWIWELKRQGLYDREYLLNIANLLHARAKARMKTKDSPWGVLKSVATVALSMTGAFLASLLGYGSSVEDVWRLLVSFIGVLVAIGGVVFLGRVMLDDVFSKEYRKLVRLAEMLEDIAYAMEPSQPQIVLAH